MPYRFSTALTAFMRLSFAGFYLRLIEIVRIYSLWRLSNGRNELMCHTRRSVLVLINVIDYFCVPMVRKFVTLGVCG